MSKIIKKKYYGDSTNTPIAETIEETIPDNSDDRIFELEKQLHEQYAVNNNSNAGTLISLISALLISFTGYGYVMYRYRIGECTDIAIVNLAAIVVMAVMMLLYCISLHLGAGQRMEQFITFGIRAKYYQNQVEQYKSIFPKGYMPFGKKYCDFVQGLYNMWTKVLIITIFDIAIIHYYMTDAPCIVLLFGILFIVVSLLFRCCKYKRYLKRENAESKKHSAFISKIKQDEPEVCVCDKALFSIVASIFVCSILFIIINVIYPKSNVEPPTKRVSVSVAIDVENINIKNK